MIALTNWEHPFFLTGADLNPLVQIIVVPFKTIELSRFVSAEDLAQDVFYEEGAMTVKMI